MTDLRLRANLRTIDKTVALIKNIVSILQEKHPNRDMSYIRRKWFQLRVKRLHYKAVKLDNYIDDPLSFRPVDKRSRNLTLRIMVKDLETGKTRKFEYNRHKSFVTEIIPIQHGSAYYITCEVYMDTDLSPVAETSHYYHTYVIQPVTYMTPLSKAQLNLLKSNAIKVVSHGKRNPFVVNCLFRNNHPEYFEDIKRNWENTMLVSPKNPDGDFRSPISNGIMGPLEGIEFNVGKKGFLPRNSPFGDTRLVIPMERLINRNSWNLYFADLYCYGKGHYVLLVVTRSGSNADKWWAHNLPQLPWIPNNSSSENPFFFYDQEAGTFKASQGVRVSILYTENVKIDETADLFMRGFGARTVGYGKLKEPSCIICNLDLIPRSELKFCSDNKCTHCSYISQMGCIKSNTNGKTFDCLSKATCKIQNLVYAVECDLCRTQYVGVTKLSLGLRISKHLGDIIEGRSCPLAEHMNSHQRCERSNTRTNIPMSVFALKVVLQKEDNRNDDHKWRYLKQLKWNHRLKATMLPNYD